MKFFLTLICSLFSLSVLAQVEKKIPARPSPPKLVNDFTNTLTPAQVQALEAKLVAYDDSTSSQVAIVIVQSLEGYDISEYALAIGRTWGIGSKEFNNGLLILVAKEDRKIKIEVGYGLEGAIPDITAKHIIDDAITPQFKEGNFYRGLDRGTDDIFKAAAGEYKAPLKSKKKTKKISLGALIGLVLFFLVFGLLGGGGRSSGGTMSGAGWIIGSLLGSGGGRGGWSGGSSGGGGFGGFGGGGFGGGGASGSW